MSVSVIIMEKHLKTGKIYSYKSNQDRRQDSVTGGAEINFLGGHEKFIYVNSRRGTRAREIYSSVDQTNKVKTKKKGFHFKNFLKFWLSSENPCDFSRILSVKTKKKVFVPKVL